jgi:MFS family permease
MATRSSVRQLAATMATVFRRPSLRRLNLALAGSAVGDWAYSTAITVWAYGEGGAAAVGIWGTVRFTLMAVTSPFGAALADRISRKTVMIACDLVRSVLVLAAAGLVLWEGPPASVYVLATLSPIVGTAFHPAQLALTPSLVKDPQELTAANAVASTLESLAFFIGPALAGLLLAVADIPTVFAFNAATFVVSAVLVAGLPTTGPMTATSVDGGAEPALAAATGGTGPGFLSEALEGFRVVVQNPALRLVVGIYCAQTVVAGASLVFGVAIALELTDLGPAGVGYLDSVLGVGAMLGGLLAAGLAVRRHPATDFGWGVVFWTLPLVLIAVWPTTWAAFLAMFLIGVANPVVDVNASTIVQRITPDAVLGRVFGAMESGLIATMALGSLAMPLLIAGLGLRWGLVAVSAPVALLGLAAMARLHRLNLVVSEPEEVTLLSAVPLFQPLVRPLIEMLAGRLSRVEVPAGTTVVREGAHGDRFYVVQSGVLDATYGGEHLSRMGAGECFGEIALLHDTPRTASVVARDDCVLYTLDRDDFLAAMEGDHLLRFRVEALAARRIPTA